MKEARALRYPARHRAAHRTSLKTSDGMDSQTSQTLGPNNAKRAFLGRGVGASLAMWGTRMGMTGFETRAVVDLDGGDDRYHNPHVHQSAAVGLGMTGLSHPDRVVKCLGKGGGR